MKFYKCLHCGNVVVYLDDKGPKVICCGEVMGEIVPGTVDASVEKHTPVVTVSGSAVSVAVGSVPHPMTAEHHIEWIVLETNLGFQMHNVSGDAANADFVLAEGESPVATYAYCNLHGLWKA